MSKTTREYYDAAVKAVARALDALIVLEMNGGDHYEAEAKEARGHLRQAVKSAEKARTTILGVPDDTDRK